MTIKDVFPSKLVIFTHHSGTPNAHFAIKLPTMKIVAFCTPWHKTKMMMILIPQQRKVPDTKLPMILNILISVTIFVY